MFKGIFTALSVMVSSAYLVFPVIRRCRMKGQVSNPRSPGNTWPRFPRPAAWRSGSVPARPLCQVKPSPRPRSLDGRMDSPVELANAEAEYRGVGSEDRRSCL